MKTIILALLITANLAISANLKVDKIPVSLPSWVKYKTIDAYGVREYWATKPYLRQYDGGGYFWDSETSEMFYGRIEGGLPSKHNWKHSLRRVR